MKLNQWFVFIVAAMMLSGCIRLVGKAGYVKDTPEEHTSKVIGFDTNP